MPRQILTTYLPTMYGQNGQVPTFAKINNVLLLFEKYLTIYHSFKTRVKENRVCYKNKSLVNKTRAL